MPRHAAGKIDRSAIPSARDYFDRISSATDVVDHSVPETADEVTMAQGWKHVLSRDVAMSTPFGAYGGNSLTAMQLRTQVKAVFGKQAQFEVCFFS